MGLVNLLRTVEMFIQVTLIRRVSVLSCILMFAMLILLVYGHCYFATFVDSGTRCTWVYLMNSNEGITRVQNLL